MKKIITHIIALLYVSVALAQVSVTIEAPSPDPTLTVRGPEKNVTLFNDVTWKSKIIIWPFSLLPMEILFVPTVQTIQLCK